MITDKGILIVIAFFQGIVVILLTVGLKEFLSLTKTISGLKVWSVQHEKTDDERHLSVLNKISDIKDCKKSRNQDVLAKLENLQTIILQSKEKGGVNEEI